MNRFQSNLLLVLLASILGLLTFLAWGQAEQGEGNVAADDQPLESSDPREVVKLNEDQLAFALGQMRGFLQAIQDLDAAELEGDLDKMAELAHVHGPGIERGRPEGFRERLPASFRAISGPMRKSFAELEQHLRAGNLEAYKAKRLETLNACNACHESFRFQLDAAQ